MTKKYIPYDPYQTFLFPPNPREWLPDDHLALFIADVVRELDLSPIFSHYERSVAGAPPYHPTMMVAVLLYAYCRGTPSSRRIARAVVEDVGFRYLAAGNMPDFRTISDFRKTHLEALKGLFRQVLQLCRKAGLVKLGVVALDGTKVKASASLATNRSYEALCREERRLEEEIGEALTKGVEVDEKEDSRHGRDVRGDKLPPGLRTREKRLERLKKAKRELEREAKERAKVQEEKLKKRARREAETGRKLRGRKPREPDPSVAPEAKANTTDPESRIMKTSKGYIQGYNAQAVVDCKSCVIVAQAVVQEANDVHQLSPMMRQVVENTGEVPRVGTADAGYWSEAELQAVPPGIDPYVATRKSWKQRALLRELPPPRGRIPADATTRERMERKLLTKRGRVLYKMRTSTVEPVFGQIKVGRGLDNFLMRGMAKVEGEWSLFCTTHNLLKLYRNRRRLGAA